MLLVPGIAPLVIARSGQDSQGSRKLPQMANQHGVVAAGLYEYIEAFGAQLSRRLRA
jgi:hypothetical protein